MRVDEMIIGVCYCAEGRESNPTLRWCMGTTVQNCQFKHVETRFVWCIMVTHPEPSLRTWWEQFFSLQFLCVGILYHTVAYFVKMIDGKHRKRVSQALGNSVVVVQSLFFLFFLRSFVHCHRAVVLGSLENRCSTDAAGDRTRPRDQCCKMTWQEGKWVLPQKHLGKPEG